MGKSDKDTKTLNNNNNYDIYEDRQYHCKVRAVKVN